MKQFGLFFFIFLQITSIYTSNLITPFTCLPWDTPCLSALAQKLSTPRIFDLNALKIDPFEIDHFKLEKDGLEFETKDTKVHGLKNMIVEEFRTDANTSTAYIKIRTDVIVTGLYKADGSLFYMPLNSEGDYWTSLRNLVINVEAPYKIVRSANGEPLLETSDYKLSYDVKDGAEFRLNSYNYGIPGFSELLNQLINYNWKYISSNFITEFVSNAVENIAKTHKSYFRISPFEFLVQ
ncbi:uncharacterized protein LOC112043111 [Bicyclus anynana]|uniref:Uncharacterized protein LOC112043111 n=1 Tax=Bicyclus anynana TaxID=110368 RepID=A0A6J1MMJ7_BICAN|nr:uncharacterized protein LOC112043111 [Bicyclus anynana]